MQKLRSSYHMEGFTNGSGCIFKEIFDQVWKDLDCELFYSEPKRHNVSTLYLLSSHIDNIHIVLENDNIVCVNKKDLNVASHLKKHASYRNVLW